MPDDVIAEAGDWLHENSQEDREAGIFPQDDETLRMVRRLKVRAEAWERFKQWYLRELPGYRDIEFGEIMKEGIEAVEEADRAE